MKQLMGILLRLVMVLGMMTGMSLTALADDTGAYNEYLVTTATNNSKSGDELTALQVTFNGRPLTISPAVLTIEAENKEKIYGDADPELTLSSGALSYGDERPFR